MKVLGSESHVGCLIVPPKNIIKSTSWQMLALAHEMSVVLPWALADFVC